MERLGIDIGSKTIKIVLTDEDGSLLFSNYLRHFSKVKDKLLGTLRDLVWKLGDREVAVTVTGSAGLRVAELFKVPFVQEVVALKTAVRAFEPEADVVLEMGGEDTKLVYLTGVPEQRMNTVCAGGTGGFIDMMAGLMGKRNEDMQALAEKATTIYPIASRCAVFAKSDVRPLLNAGAKKEDVAASVLEAVCTQAVAGLSAGRPIKGTVILLGGPFQYTPALRDAFCRVTGIDKEHAIIPSDAHLFVARGAALSPEHSATIMLSALEAAVEAADFSNQEGIKRLPPLFERQEDYLAFRKAHDTVKIPRRHLIDSTENLFLGIDAGSTTMKMALVDESGALVAYEYDWNEGDVTVSFNWMLSHIYAQINGAWIPDKTIRRSCIVGYGEDFCRAAYGVDDGEVETVAHLRAATALEPDVDFLMDIGGQDIKCFYVHDGMISDIVLNEACSSGCGSLFDDIARSMRRTKEGFAKDALFAKAPVDLGTRCSTFMDSRVKHAQKEGATQGDVAAGIAYSTARNALYKVVREPDFSKVGKHVVVQGGAFANDAILRAFELETKTTVTRPDLAQLMGAWGAALLARDRWMSLRSKNPQAADNLRSTLISPEELSNMRIDRSSARCDQCGNRCKLMVTRFFEGWNENAERSYVTGNRCEKGAIAYEGKRSQVRRPPNMIAAKNALIDACDSAPQPQSEHVIGIPRALSLYESYPFWKRFFNELGYSVLKGRPSSEEIYRCGMGSIPSEGACYPSKLLFGHATDLAERGADVIFAPALNLAFSRAGLLGAPVRSGARDCPLIEELPQMLQDNAEGTALEKVRFVAPSLLTARGLEDIVEPLVSALAEAGLSHTPQQVRAALDAAQRDFAKVFEKLSKKNDELLARIDSGELRGALVAGHPYHADPGISHRIDELLGNLGYAVLEQVDYRFEEHLNASLVWTPSSELAYAARMSARHPNLQFIYLRSFGCGIDALMADAVHEELRGAGRVYAELKLDQIVDLAAVRIRLRSLDYATRQRNGEVAVQSVLGGSSTDSGRLSIEDYALPDTHLRGVDEEKADLTEGVQIRMVDSEKVGEYWTFDRSDHSDLKEQMARHGYTFIVDRTAHVSHLAFFVYIIFGGPDGALYFDDWGAVADFVANGCDERIPVEGMKTGQAVPAEAPINPTDPRASKMHV